MSNGDDVLLISGSADSTVKLWNIQTGECRGTLGQHKGAVININVDSVKLNIWTAAEDSKVRVWNAQVKFQKLKTNR